MGAENIKEVVNDTLIDSLEKLVESLVDNEVANNIPYVKGVIAILKDANNWVDKQELEALSLFFEECKSADLGMVKSFMQDKAKNDKVVGRRFIDSIRSLNQDEKRILAGRVYKKVVEERYDLDDFYRIIDSINKIYFNDLYCLTLFKNDEEFCNNGSLAKTEAINCLYHVGLLRTAQEIDGGTAYTKDDEYKFEGYFLSEYGRIIRDIL